MRVALAEDNPLLRDGIALVLGDHGIEVVAAVDNSGDLRAAVAQHRPELAIIDVRMPPTYTDEGIRAALDIRATEPQTAVLVFSQWVERDYARRLLADNPAKVGYLLKDRIVGTDEFVGAARRVAAGGTALDPEVVRQLLSAPSRDQGLARLTDRERQILAKVAEGRTNRAIAAELYLAESSVEKHITAIFRKLGLAAGSNDHRRVLAVLRYLNGR